MRKRMTKSEIYRKLDALRHELNCMNGKRDSGHGNNSWRYSYNYSNRDRSANYRYWEATAIDKEKKIKPSDDKFSSNGFLDTDKLMKAFPKYVSKYNTHSSPSIDWKVKQDLENKFFLKVNFRINTISREISKLNTLKFNLIGSIKKQSVGDNLAELVTQGSTKPLENLRFCSPTGREVKIKFDMNRHKREDRYGSTDNAHPKTPAEIGLHRLRGFCFDAEYHKIQLGWSYAYNSYEQKYINENYTRGILYYANEHINNQVIANKVSDFKANIRDTIWCVYLDSAGHKRYPLKFKDIYLLNLENKKVDKKLMRVNKALDRGIAEFYASKRPDKNQYNIPSEEISKIARQYLRRAKDKQFCDCDRRNYVYNYIRAYLDKLPKP